MWTSRSERSEVSNVDLSPAPGSSGFLQGPLGSLEFLWLPPGSSMFLWFSKPWKEVPTVLWLKLLGPVMGSNLRPSQLPNPS